MAQKLKGPLVLSSLRRPLALRQGWYAIGWQSRESMLHMHAKWMISIERHMLKTRPGEEARDGSVREDVRIAVHQCWSRASCDWDLLGFVSIRIDSLSRVA